MASPKNDPLPIVPNFVKMVMQVALADSTPGVTLQDWFASYARKDFTKAQAFVSYEFFFKEPPKTDWETKDGNLLLGPLPDSWIRKALHSYLYLENPSYFTPFTSTQK